MANGLAQATKAINLLGAMRRLRKGQREEEGPTTVEIRMQEFAIREQRQARQYRINKWTELWNGAEGVNKKHIQRLLQDDWDSFDGETKRTLSPLLRFTPVGEMERKKRLFLESKPRPSWSGHIPEEKPHEWASEWFAQKDWQWQYETYMGLTPPAIPKTVQVKTDLYAKREEGGIVRMISTESERWDEVAKGHDTTKEALAIAGFQVDIGTKRTVKNGPMIYETVQRRDLLTGKEYVETTPVMKDIGVKVPEAPKDALEFVSFHATDQEDDTKPMGRLYTRYKQLLEEKVSPNQALKMTIGTAFPNWNFKMVGGGEYGKGDWFFHNYHRGDKEFIAFFPGKLAAFPALSDTIKYYYYDAVTDTVYNGRGERKGTYEEVVSEAMLSEGEPSGR